MNKHKVNIDNLETLRQFFVSVAKKGKDTLLKELCTTNDGLTENEATNVRMQVGLNEIGQKKRMPWWLNLWYCYKNPLSYLLTLLAIISSITNDKKSAVAISLLIILIRKEFNGISRLCDRRACQLFTDATNTFIGAEFTV